VATRGGGDGAGGSAGGEGGGEGAAAAPDGGLAPAVAAVL
jgi:hypothetical protein